METSEDSVGSIREGLAAGAYYYLTKPMQPELLQAVVDAALAQYRQWVDSPGRRARGGERPAVARVRRLPLPHPHRVTRDLASGLARGCPDPKRVVLGLQELLTNAVEHGNLGISYADKTRLVLENRWVDEVERRLSQPDYAQRTVTVTLSRASGEHHHDDPGRGRWIRLAEVPRLRSRARL
jgi:DNA-binding response OmpR family regulator